MKHEQCSYSLVYSAKVRRKRTPPPPSVICQISAVLSLSRSWALVNQSWGSFFLIQISWLFAFEAECTDLLVRREEAPKEYTEDYHRTQPKAVHELLTRFHCMHTHTHTALINPSLTSEHSTEPTTPGLTAGLKAPLTAGAYALAWSVGADNRLA